MKQLKQRESKRIHLKSFMPDKISKDTLIVAAITMSFVTLAYLRRLTGFKQLYDLVRAAWSCIALYIYVWKRPKQTKRSFAWIYTLVLIYLVNIISTIIHHGPPKTSIKNMIFTVGFCILIDYYLQKDILNTMAGVRLAMELIMWANLATVILFPHGLYSESNELHSSTVNPAFLLGHRNNAIEMLIPLIGIAMLEAYLVHQNFNFCVQRILFGSFATVLLTWSANAVLCVSVFILYYLIRKRKHMKFYNTWTFFFLSAAASFGLTVLRVEYYFEWLIVGILHKSMTLSTRTMIWERAVPCIAKSPLIGYGVELGEVKFPKIRAVNSCHNYFLDCLYYGGIIMMVLVFLLFYMSVKRVGELKDIRLQEIIATTFGAYFILFIASPVHRNNLSWMFVFWLLVYDLTASKQIKQFISDARSKHKR